MLQTWYIGLKKLIFLNSLISVVFCTFSIVAFDPETGEIGSAGASCIANSIIISEIIPGIGAINTQSYYLSQNQNYASSLMIQNYSPQEIISFLEINDFQNNPSIRQYGIVSLNQNISSAGFTGENCSDWKGHLTGYNYSIQGNILIDNSILESMEASFTGTNGPLSFKLMAALQAAKVPGADYRCLDEGISSYSAFIRLAEPNDESQFTIDLNVNSVIPYYFNNGIWIDPIDSLQIAFDNYIFENFEYNKGDINQDLIIDILDIIIIVNIVLGQSTSGVQFLLSDINSDNIINIQDIIMIVNSILN